MKTKLFLAALCIFLLPVCFTSSNQASSQFSTYACSGVVIHVGINCTCEYEECICAPDAPISQKGDGAKFSQKASTGLSYEALFAITAVMLWLRLRA